MNVEELGHFGDDIRLPCHHYLNITMKKIKLQHKEAAEEGRHKAHHIAALSSPGSDAGLQKYVKPAARI